MSSLCHKIAVLNIRPRAVPWMHKDHVRSLLYFREKSGEVSLLRAKMAEHPELLITVCSTVRPPSLQGKILRESMKCVLCSTRLTWLNKGRIQKRKEKNTSRFPGKLVCAQVKPLMRSSRKIQCASGAKWEPSRSKAAGYRRRRVLPALVSHKQCFVERDRP